MTKQQMQIITAIHRECPEYAEALESAFPRVFEDRYRKIHKHPEGDERSQRGNSLPGWRVDAGGKLGND